MMKRPLGTRFNDQSGVSVNDNAKKDCRHIQGFSPPPLNSAGTGSSNSVVTQVWKTMDIIMDKIPEMST